MTLKYIFFQCHHNATLYNLLHLESVYNVRNLTNWRDHFGIGKSIQDLKDRIRIDGGLRNIEILSPQAERDLLELSKSEISDLNLTQYTRLMHEQITNLDLDMFIQRLRRVKDRLGQTPQARAVKIPIDNQILFLEQMQIVVKQLEMGIRQLRTSVESLERDAKFNKVTMREALQGKHDWHDTFHAPF